MNELQVCDSFNYVDDDDAASSLIKGAKVKFGNDAVWTANGEAIAAGREFIAVEKARALQKWVGGLPVETRILAPDERMPDAEIARLNEEAPRTEWRTLFGRELGPWERAYILYVLDPHSMAGLTYATSTAGGSRAIRELSEATRRARMLKGANVFPVITFSNTFMRTQYGGRQRPHFVIQRFVSLDPEHSALNRSEPKALAEPERPAPKPQQTSRSTDLDDEILF